MIRNRTEIIYNLITCRQPHSSYPSYPLNPTLRTPYLFSIFKFISTANHHPNNIQHKIASRLHSNPSPPSSSIEGRSRPSNLIYIGVRLIINIIPWNKMQQLLLIHQKYTREGHLHNLLRYSCPTAKNHPFLINQAFSHTNNKKEQL